MSYFNQVSYGSDLQITRMLLFRVFSLVCIMLSNTSMSAALTGQVIAVKSAAEITLSLGDEQFRKVRLLAVEPPPIHTLAGRKSRQHLMMLLAGKFVTVSYNSLNKEGDILGRVFHGGADINLRLLESGQAQIDTQDDIPKELDERYRKAQNTAIKNRVGIWNLKRRLSR